MKNLKNYLAYCSVFLLLLAGCSKEESSAIDDPSTSNSSATLTFGAVLNDLANRAMTKQHFNQVPDCSDADPAVAVIDFSYGGNDYTAVVDILEDEEGYFTDYSEDLKILVPNNSSVMVTLNGFKVYDGDTTVPSASFYDATYGNLIWIAPIESTPGQFDGYVNQALPYEFSVSDGTKPYIDIEVLCFDRRMANEYGYVFFDILPETIYPLCLFVNYCNADGRHWVADYSVDLYFGTSVNGIELYNHNDAGAMATTGDYNANNEMDPNYYADPLCLVVPGPPANLAADEPYLYLVIYPADWSDSYGDIDNTPVPVALTWEMVNDLLNDDGTTNEYLHLLVGECDNALSGDGTIGGGGNECENDLDGDNICDDQDDDIDGDGILNINENEGCIYDASPTCGISEPVACDKSISDPALGCIRGETPGSDPADYASSGEFLMISSGQDGNPMPLLEDQGTSYGASAGNFVPSITSSTFSFDISGNSDLEISDYLVEVKDTENGDVTCVTSGTTLTGTFTYPVFIRVSANICPVPN